MKESLGLYIFFLFGWMLLSTYWYTCHIRHACIPESFAFTAGRMDASRDSLFSLKITGTHIGAADNIKFIRSHPEPVISGPVKLAFNDVATFLSFNEDMALEITGVYAAEEKNNSLVSNLGEARAETFRTWLVLQGIDRKRVVTRFAENDSLTFTHDTLSNGLTFRMVEMPEEKSVGEKEISAVEARLKANNKPLYFEPSSTQLEINEALRKYVRDLKVYLDANPDKTITLTGHTDESGDKETNFRVGRIRADYVRQLFSEAGIDYQQMRTNSKGESMPVASNDTSEGQRKNRRVEIAFSW